uniref:Putative gastrula zinc finger protein n=1 Tax=Culex tarsalis TaxID=7177 RepID=A0A1Q3F1T4_CULTA
MASKCAACGLRFDHIKRFKLKSVAFHRFPADPVQRKAWEDFCGETALKLGKVLCSDHFTAADYRSGTKRLDAERKRRLRDGAVPTVREGVTLKEALKKTPKRPKRAVKYLKAEGQLQPVTKTPVKTEKVCRICESDGTLHDLSLEENAEHARRFSSLTSLEIYAAPPWFCEGCLGRLNDAYDFIQQCVEAESKRKSLALAAEVKQEQQGADCLAEPLVELPLQEPIKEEPDENELTGDSDSEPEQPKQHTCQTCQATFEKRSELFAHFKTHGKARFPCNLCDSTFARRFLLQEHLLAHKTGPSFFCAQCPTGFKTKTSLNQHVKYAHLRLKPFVCEECGKKFAQKTHLQQHAMVHTKEAEVACERCEMKFKTGQRWREHLRAEHGAGEDLGLAPYECDVCFKIFPNQLCLRGHKYGHREPTVLCSICGKKYKTTTLMKVHMKISHDAEQLFQCEQCPEKFKTEKSLKYHRLSHAAVKPPLL